jgi:N-acetylneuraminic acid mutarotase
LFTKESDTEKTAFSDFYSFSVLTHEWKKITPSNGVSPSARSHANSFCLDGRIYIFQGWDSDNVVLNDLWMFNISTETWKIIETFGQIPRERFQCSTSLDDKDLWIYGGVNWDSETLSYQSLHDLYKIRLDPNSENPFIHLEINKLNFNDVVFEFNQETTPNVITSILENIDSNIDQIFKFSLKNKFL